MATKNEREATAAKIVGKLPSKGKLLCNLEQVTKEDRARAGITDEMANAMVSSNQPQPKGIRVVRGPWQAHEGADVEVQTRVINYDTNQVLFSGTEDEYRAYKKALAAAKED